MYNHVSVRAGTQSLLANVQYTRSQSIANSDINAYAGTIYKYPFSFSSAIHVRGTRFAYIDII